MNYGLLKAMAITPALRVADSEYNSEKIIEGIKYANECGAEIVIFPELSITSASCGDMFKNNSLLMAAKSSLEKIVEECKYLPSLNIVGAPIGINGKVYNCAILFQEGEIINIVAKKYIPNREARWFTSGENISDYIDICSDMVTLCDNTTLSTKEGVTLSVALGEDITKYSYSSEIIAVPFIFPETVGYYKGIKENIKTISRLNSCAILFASAGVGESSTDFAYGGGSIIAENGEILREGERFCDENSYICCDIDTEILKHERGDKEISPVENSYLHLDMFNTVNNADFKLDRHISPTPFIPEDKDALSERCEEIFNIQTAALVRRMRHTNSKKAVIGISGGLDSTLALLVAVNAFDKMGIDRSGIVAITMPGFGTTDRTYNNAVNMIKSLGATFKEISIKDACIQHFKDIEHDGESHDVTYENSQARERTQILMDYANKTGALHLGTGDMSELALGWATYNGDHISMYNVNGSIPKTLAKYMVAWIALRNEGDIRSTLLDVVNTPISPELTPADENGNIKQKTEDIVGPYELHDFYMYYFLRYGFSASKIYFLAKRAFEGKYDDECIKMWLKTFLRRFFQQQFKRSCLNDGPAVGVISLSPRGGLVLPSDMSSAIWMDECEKL